MVYPIRKHEVDRLLSVVVMMGWELVQEINETDSVTVQIRRKLSPELLQAEREIEKLSTPQ